ncbi:condensation domain-containing protein [Yinghuangia soli]|uniref:Condensation domain-containing protein n=1 Tax=Yinghuangia soli TaxID=2908204 RepID=A0AA41U3P4_9ACTN|nr:condensation domain-containing protein [Yinghuangia soli]MCF2532035.1 condensation domain-containing protein [Yinghuangia soli]
MTAPSREEETCALSYAQELLHLVDLVNPGSVFDPDFIVRAAFRVRGPVDTGVLQAALDDVVARHGALRTEIVRDGSDGSGTEPYQRILPPMPARLVVESLPAGSDPDAFVARVAGQGHDWRTPPLLWAYLGRYPDDEPGGADPVLVLVAHHIAADAWSLGVLARDLVAAYTARTRGEPPLAADVMQYTEIAADDRCAKTQERYAASLEFWRPHLAGTAGRGLPAQYPDAPPGPTAVHRFVVPDELAAAVGKAARRARTTPFTLMLTAFTQGVLPDRDTVVPVVTAGRLPSEWNSVGFLMNMLAIRIDRADGPGLGELRTRIDAALRQAYAHETGLLVILQAVPEMFASLTTRDRVPPAFQLIPPTPVRPAADPALDLAPLGEEGQPALAIPLPFLWSMRSDAGPLRGYVTYDSNLFDTAWMTAKTQAFLQVLARLADPAG